VIFYQYVAVSMKRSYLLQVTHIEQCHYQWHQVTLRCHYQWHQVTLRLF